MNPSSSNGRLLKTVFGLLLAFSVVRHTVADTDENRSIDRFYVGAEGGGIFPETTNYSAVVPISATQNVTLSGHVKWDSGPAIGFFVGYHVKRWLAAQADFEYAKFYWNSFKGTITSGTTALPITIGATGPINTYNVLINAIFTPIKSRKGFTPYAGLGAGISSLDGYLTSISSGGITALALNQRHSEADLAADLLIGANFDVTPQWSIGARYQLLYIDKHGDALISGPGGSASYGTFLTHGAQFVITYHL